MATSLGLESSAVQVPAQPKQTKARMIDFHSHAFPGELFRQLSKYYPQIVQIKEEPGGRLFGVHGGVTIPVWDDALRVSDMDAAGVDLEILSCPALYTALDQNLAALCRMTNDTLANSCRRYPEQFKALAHIPFEDMGLAVEEMSRCLDQLGFVGIFVPSNIGGHYLDEPQFEPFWAEVSRRRVPVFLHPLLSPCYRDSEAVWMFSFPYDSTLAVTRLITRGLFERYPDLTLVVSHLGGVLPYLAQRIDIGFEVPGFKNADWKISRPPSEYMKKLYFDTAMSWNLGAFNCARELVGIKHILLGTDYFIRESHWMERTKGFLGSLDMAPGDRELLYEGNASRILKIT